MLVLPPMSARTARVGECFGLFAVSGDSSHAGHMEESSNRSFAFAFYSRLSTISSTVIHFNFEPVSHGTTNESIPASTASDFHITLFLRCRNNR